MTEILKQELSATLKSRVGALLSKDALRRLKAKIDYKEYGGAPLLGVNGNWFHLPRIFMPQSNKKCHPATAPEFAKQRVNDHLVTEMGRNEEIQKLLPKKKIWNQIKERIISKDREEEGEEKIMSPRDDQDHRYRFLSASDHQNQL